MPDVKHSPETDAAPTVYTVGHSNHPIESFIGLLRGAGIEAVADVRSSPFSRRMPQFSQPALNKSLRAAGIAYVFLGKELGARPQDRSCYRNGAADYDLIARTDLFQHGLDRVVEGARRYRIALMCAEKEPLDCHRAILVARHLKARGIVVHHILADGRIEPHEATERRLLAQTNGGQSDLFAAPGGQSDPLEAAYRQRGAEIAYSEGTSAAAEAAPAGLGGA